MITPFVENMALLKSMEDGRYIKKIGENIKKARKAQKIAQKDLAYDCGIEKQNMYRLEAGRTNPTIKLLRKVAKALSLSVKDLLPE